VAINWTLSKGALALVGIRSVAQVRATQDNHRYHLISLLTTSRDTLCYVYRGLHFLRDHQHHLDQWFSSRDRHSNGLVQRTIRKFRELK